MEIGDAAAVALARTGDSDAFRLLVDRHSRRMFRLAYRLTGSEADAEDIVQETFLRAYRNLDRFEERAVVGSWLYRIATNCALDLIRSRKAQAVEVPAAPEPPVQPAPERAVMDGQVQRQIDAALAALSPQERVAFTLRHFEGRGIEEISEILQTSGSSAKQAVFRAVQKLRRALRSVEEGAPAAAAAAAGVEGGVK
jgi:RNA polymerase sigma-70 factor, ECF subfamily